MNRTITTTATTSAAATAVPNAEYWQSAVSPTSLPSSPPPSPAAILSPCAACKTLRRRCADKCVLAPYFPPSEPFKFAIAHRIFGASNIIKMVQGLPEAQRADAVNSMVYEANARLRDPIYGCTGAICHLQKQVNELQVELARKNVELLNMQCQNANLLDQVCERMATTQEIHDDLAHDHEMQNNENSTIFFDEGLLMVDRLWT